MMRVAGDDVDGVRLRGLIVVLWRAGLRISEALALAESDLDAGRGAILVRRGLCRIRHRPRRIRSAPRSGSRSVFRFDTIPLQIPPGVKYGEQVASNAARQALMRRDPRVVKAWRELLPALFSSAQGVEV